MKRIFEFLVTGCYSGYSPIASGTAGTVVAIPLYLIMSHLPFFQYLLVILISLVPVALLCLWGEKYFEKEDPSEVVIDEVVGYLVTMIALPVNIFNIVAGFFVFRFFDIVKPPPAYEIQKLPHGWGVLIDDVVAGIYANLSMWIIYSSYKLLIRIF